MVARQPSSVPEPYDLAAVRCWEAQGVWAEEARRAPHSRARVRAHLITGRDGKDACIRRIYVSVDMVVAFFPYILVD